MSTEDNSVFGTMFPYAERYGITRRFPEQGMPREKILEDLIRD